MVSNSDKSAEQSDKGDVPAVSKGGTEIVQLFFDSKYVAELEDKYDALKQEIDYLKAQNNALDTELQKKIDKLRRMQIATYKLTTTKQYQMIEQEAQAVNLEPTPLGPPEFFYFPKIGMQRCQCEVCKGIATTMKNTKDGTEGILYRLTGIGQFEGHSGFKEADARYICEFLNKHPEYMHKLANLDKDRFV